MSRRNQTSLRTEMNLSSDMDSNVISSPEEVAELYREQSHFPSLRRANVGPVITSQYGGKYNNISTEWTQRDLEKNEIVKFCRQYIVFHDDKSIVYSGPSGKCREIKGELLSQDSPSGDMKAVVRECSVKGEKTQFLEIWQNNSKVKSLNLSAVKKHGKVNEDEDTSCLVWSDSETHLLYVAEKKHLKTESYFQSEFESISLGDDEEVKVVEKEDINKNDQFVYYEDWTEALINPSTPVLCILDIEGNDISVLEGDYIAIGEAFWAPYDTGVVFVGWWHEPFRLGPRYYPKRQSSLFYVNLSGGKCEQLCNTTAVCSPRLSPDHSRLVYFECEVYGPHYQCNKLCMLDWCTNTTSVVVDMVKRGLYSSVLSHQCWSGDSQRVLISSVQRSRKDILVVDTSTGQVTSLTSNSDAGSWSLLTIHTDLMVASCSSPNCPPSLRVAFLPASGSETDVLWVTLEDAHIQPEIDWQAFHFTPPPPGDKKQYSDLDFDAVLLKPNNVKQGQKPPLIVKPHGGPHSLIMAEWLLGSAVLCRMGFGVLHVNYRGSLGYGQNSIFSMPGNIGTQDVKDVQFVVQSVLKRGDFDRQNVVVIGGSSGGFLACHLIGQYPDFYKACVALNPVTNLASLIGSIDIPDWCMVEDGFDFNTDTMPSSTMLEQMLNKSPIKYVREVKTPVLLILGAEDRCVPYNQGIEYYNALKTLQVPVRLLWYPESNHSLSKVDAESDGFMNIALWTIQHLTL